MNDKFTVYTDCANFPLDRPCTYQKNANMHCVDCGKYRKLSKEKSAILIIKLGAMGDVLRTTFMLEGLRSAYPNSEIVWIVNKNNAAVLEGNQYIDKIIINDENAGTFLSNSFFPVVINLDLAPESLSLAKLANCAKVYGYTLDNYRNIVSSGEAAKKWLSMSAYDELKKANSQTYQHWMAEIAELPKDNYEIIVPLQERSKEKAAKLIAQHKTGAGKKIIGLNPGAGKRWKMKKWRTGGFIAVAKHFSSLGHTILLLGGNEDKEDMTAIMNEKLPNVFTTGTDNPIPDFFAMINLCDIVVCGDTMALHAAAGLKKNVVAIFGPTSLAEIELYGRGTKLQSDKGCVCCYNQECHINDNCMDQISDEEVIEAVNKYL